MRDLPAAPLDQVSRGQLADRLVVRAHETGLHPGNRPVNQDEWSIPSLDLFERPSSGLRRRQNQSVHLARQQGLGFALFQFGILFEVRNDDVIAMRPHRLSNRFSNLREKRVGKIRKQQSNGEGTPGHQAASDPVGLIVELFRPSQDFLAGRDADLPLVPQDLGHGHYGNVQDHGRCPAW